MALVQCRECGKMVSEEADVCPYCGAKMPSKKRKQRRLYITIVIILAIAGLFAYGYHRVSQAFAPPATTSPTATPSKIQKDIPVKDQIIQKSDKEIVKEMLDSGERIGAISKKTGIRRDEIKKIKKEKEQEDKSK